MKNALDQPIFKVLDAIKDCDTKEALSALVTALVIKARGSYSEEQAPHIISELVNCGLTNIRK